MAVTDLSILLDKSKILAWFGRNSIVIYVVQFAMTMFLANFAKKLFGWPVGAYPHYFLVFLCVVVLLVPVVYLANAFFPFLLVTHSVRNSSEDNIHIIFNRSEKNTKK